MPLLRETGWKVWLAVAFVTAATEGEATGRREAQVGG